MEDILEKEEVILKDFGTVDWRELDSRSLELALVSLEETLSRLEKARSVRQETLTSEISV